MTKQVVVGGFTVTFNGVTPVLDGYEWSYTIKNDGTEKDLSNWVLQLFDCCEKETCLPCSLGCCECVLQECPSTEDTSADCDVFRGVKFDNLPPDQMVQTFTFVLPVAVGEREGCFYLKFGQNKVCGYITVPDCADPPCPPCPTISLRKGLSFTQQLQLPEHDCALQFDGNLADYYLCVKGVSFSSGFCTSPTDITLCVDTPSQQTLTCLLPLQFLQLRGQLQIFWQFSLRLDTVCQDEPTRLTFLAVSEVPIDEICYFCEGDLPDVTERDLCQMFAIRFDQISETGLLTFTVTFLGCNR